MKRTTAARLPLGPFTLTMEQLDELLLYVCNELSGDTSEITLAKIEAHDGDTRFICDGIDEFKENRLMDRSLSHFEFVLKDEEGDKVLFICGGTRTENYILVGAGDKVWTDGASRDLRKKMKQYEVWYSIFARGLWGSQKSFVVLYFAIAALLYAAYAIYVRPSMGDDGNATLSDFSWIGVLLAPVALSLTGLTALLFPTRSRIVTRKRGVDKSKLTTFALLLAGVVIGIAQFFV